MGKKKGKGRGETRPDEAQQQGGAGRSQQEPQVGRQAQPVAPTQQLQGLSLAEQQARAAPPPAAQRPPSAQVVPPPVPVVQAPPAPQGAWGKPKTQAPAVQHLPPGMPPQQRAQAPPTQQRLPPGLPPQQRPAQPRQPPPQAVPTQPAPVGLPPQQRPAQPRQPPPQAVPTQPTPVGLPPQQRPAQPRQPPPQAVLSQPQPVGLPPSLVTQQPVQGPKGAERAGKPQGPPPGAGPRGAPATKELCIYSKGTYQKLKEGIRELEPPSRPDKGGKIGKPIRLYANHFQFGTGTKIKTAYHYDVEVMDRDKPMINKAMRRKIVYALLTTQNDVFPEHCCAFDGMKSMYTNQKLKIIGQQQFLVTILDGDREREFAVLVQWAADVDLGTITQYLKGSGSTSDIPQRAIQCIDIVMRYNQTYNRQYMPVQRSLFNPEDQKLVDLGGGALVWSGHYQSIRMGFQLFLNVDVSQKAVFKDGNVVDVMYDVIQLDTRQDPPPLDFRQTETFGKYLKGLKVIFRPGNAKREYRVNGLKGPASRETFDHEGKMTTVQGYMKSRYNLDLKYPHIPCLWVGNPNRAILVPMEFCEIIPGQVMRGKLSDVQTSNMIKVAAKPPAERRATIEAAVKTMNVARDPVANSFGFAMNTEMMKVMGRLLPPPTLEYAGNKSIVPRDGKWDMRGNRFLESAGLKNWGVLDTARVRPEQMSKFIDMLMNMAGRNGMAVEPPLFQDSCRDMPQDVERKLTELKKKHKGLKLVLIPISRKGAEIYKDIKRIGDLALNLTTQCVVSANVFKCQDQTVGNILLKINAKLGGVNNYIVRSSLPKVLHEPVLILGADVTHPAPEARREGKPSIAAVVGSSDARAMKYSGELRLQDPGKEIIEEMEDMVHKMLLKFYERNQSFNGGKPKRIIFYRDGVSEGQFREVLKWEFNAIRRACQRLNKDYSPLITFLVVQKRHNTRLFADRGEPTVGRMGNIPPGTVVDTAVVHCREFAYFLCSHEGIQGTSRPTHYHVLWDENGLSSDDMQTLTYYLCHLFARCNRSVSNPAPSYYAHLLAFRGRHHHDSMIRTGNPRPQQLIDLVEKSSTADPMFYV